MAQTRSRSSRGMRPEKKVGKLDFPFFVIKFLTLQVELLAFLWMLIIDP